MRALHFLDLFEKRMLLRLSDNEFLLFFLHLPHLITRDRKKANRTINEKDVAELSADKSVLVRLYHSPSTITLLAELWLRFLTQSNNRRRTGRHSLRFYIISDRSAAFKKVKLMICVSNMLNREKEKRRNKDAATEIQINSITIKCKLTIIHIDRFWSWETGRH